MRTMRNEGSSELSQFDIFWHDLVIARTVIAGRMLEDLNISPRDPKSIHKLSCWLCGTAGDPNRSLSAPAPAASGYHHYHRVWRVGPIKWESKLWQRDLCWNQRKRDPPWLYPNKCLMFWDLQNAPASFFEGILYTPNRGETSLPFASWLFHIISKNHGKRKAYCRLFLTYFYMNRKQLMNRNQFL